VASFLEEKELSDAYLSSKKYSENWFKPFDEFERIAANLPSEALPEHYPRVTDGTLAALVAETPMRIWGQLQTGRFVPLVNSKQDFEEWKAEMVNIIWANKIIPNANMQAPFFNKLQIALHKALIYGCQPAFSFMVANDSYVGSDFILPQIRDVKMEPGKVSANDCNYIWLDRHYNKLQIKQIIEQAKRSKDKAGWDVKALMELYDSDSFTRQDDESKHSEARKMSDYGKVVTFSTCFHRGHNAPFYTVYRDSTSSSKDKIVRHDVNRNKAGDLPINFLYNQQNLVNPYGVGQIELAGPTQNMVDFFVSAHSLATQQGLEPNIKVSGDINDENLDLDSLVYAPGGQWYTGDSQVEIVNPTNAVYSQFTNWMSMYKTQIMNLQGTSDATTSGSSSGNSQYSKTSAGVKLQQERTNAKDNYLRQRTDEFISGLAKNLVNICIHNMSGSEVIAISEDQRARLTAAGKEMPSDIKTTTIEFNEIKSGEFKFDVDANSSVVKNDDDTKDRTLETIQSLLAIPNLDQIMANEEKEIHLGELIQGLLSASGLDNVEKIVTDLSDEKREELQALMQPPQQNEDTGLNSTSQDVPIEQEETSQARLVQALRAEGWDDERIQEYINRMESTSSQEVAA
jgi:hypothetical protein